MYFTPRMKILLPLVVWLTELITWIHCKGGIGFGIKREIFFLNLEDGYFGCQVNQSTDVLQLYELSKLCDGYQDCFQGSDELARELKCTSNCVSESGLKCQNGACLDSQCHCNDGFGGCSCEVPDENECKYRPCDVFAHCTNTLGSFHCSCFPGYIGDGFHCQDINECDDPTIAGRCVQNAECCNLPAHFLCKCKTGYEGDGEIECRDINECLQPGVCGPNAVCRNVPGNFTCDCKDGYRGNPITGCTDVDECQTNLCAPGALCTNFPGGFHCECPPGTTGEAYHSSCVDVNECIANPCGLSALCKNTLGSFECICPAGFIGDPYHQCLGGEPSLPGTSCEHCPPGVPCNPLTGACGKAPGTAKTPQPCQLDTDCLETEACYNEQCEDLCSITNLCAPTAKCHVVKHRPVCTCPPGYQGNPAINCYIPKKFTCLSDVDCPINEVCLQGICQLPCSVHNPCAKNAVCLNTDHGTDCSCIEGYQGNGFVGCLPVLSYQPVCQYNEDCPPDKLCDRLNRICINPCFEDSCGLNAECIPKNHKFECVCAAGSHGNPYISCDSVIGCRSDDQCAQNEACIERKCGNPCRCGLNAICDVLYHRATCKCLQGYTGNPLEGCRAPQNPCDPNPCGMHALCELDNNNPICFCPKGMTGNPFKQCIPEGDDCRPNPCGPNSGCKVVQGSAVCFCLPEFEGDPPITSCQLPKHPCQPSPCGPNTQCTLTSDGYAKCTCLPGYVESPNTIRGCVEKRNPCDPNPCGFGAICDPNRTPCCFCPENTVGNPYKYCGEPVKTLCQPGPCGHNADCYITGNTEQCFCKNGYQGDPYSGCHQIPRNPCNPNPCGPLATCLISIEGQPTCNCPPGIMLDPNGGCTGLECTIDTDCSFNKACVAYRCRDPCPGSCGIGASCRVEKHHPVCTCNHELTGNPLIRCFEIKIESEHNPCMPYPCGQNTYCRISGKKAVCTCIENFSGDPKKGCRPGCTLNTDCAADKICVKYQCKDPCSVNNICGLGAVCLCRDHMPTCVCREGFSGNPFVQCLPKPEYPSYPNTTLPCVPSPCNPSDECQVYDGQVAMCDPCSSPTGHYNPACHPECLYNSDCPFNLACLSQKCLDPCLGSCGINANCLVVHHSPVCSCPESLTGNPYEHCSPIKTPPPTPTDQCYHSRCGSNALCKNTLGHVTCECPKGFYGNPYLACHPECVINTDCSPSKSCLNYKCTDPCHGVCGIKAHCQVINHQPVCYCPQDFTGDPLVNCYPNREYLPPSSLGKPNNPCDPSPCGPNSRCLISSHGYATCSCLPGYRGAPPLCKPECIVSTECPLTETCISQKCVNPCVGTCGVYALCYVMNHNPICSCPPGHVGDPFVMCVLPPAEPIPNVPINPCDPNPCGPNSICQIREGHPVCSCLANYLGSPPYCRPECVMNQECPFNQACINEKCQNPCIHSCGLNAKCDVVNHTPYCTCLVGYEGDAFVSCSKKPATVLPPVPRDPCTPSPCGENAQCTVQDGTARCSCIPPYIGNPYTGACRPECVMNSDCPPNAACLSSHCRDPCPGVCGINAECTVVNHVPTCTCFPDHIGDPFQSCRRKPITPIIPEITCEPSPCGPNSICQITQYPTPNTVCSCKANFIGTPPNCRPECVVSAECNPNLACISQKCSDPCPGTCGLNARCTVINHNPICSCPPNTVGDAFVRCIPEEPKQPVPLYPCNPSPCGTNAECKVTDDRAVCSCLPGMLGTPPHCRPECLIHADCPTKLACVNNKCRDPCIGSCGFNAQCTVINHQPVCSCISGYHGDPFSGCNPIPAIPTERPDPCHPSPCGANAICKERNGAGSCQCLPEFTGDPYTGCRPECVLNSECPQNKACVNNKCINPCSGVCGVYAECRVINHSPSCSCIDGYVGNPLVACQLAPKPTPKPERPRNPCIPSPCGPYSECRQIDNHAVCSCQKNYIGTPPACRPECMVSSECSQDKACIKQKCVDPCPGTCGTNARCQVVNHNPICSCSPGFSGDPFVRCIEEQPQPIEDHYPTNPCIPSPCGPNSQCRIVGNSPACSCLENYIGRPPNCRPECVINEECHPHLSCQNERCQDPCIGSCGVHTVCNTVKHVPLCNCEIGYTGDPFAGCFPIPEVPPTELPADPCNPSPCGANAICKEKNGAGSCACLPEYFGDPYTGCRPECVTNSDCDRSKACLNNKCKDPCPGTCGLNAECRVVNHAPSCYCLSGYVGDPINACHLIPTTEPSKPSNPCLPSPCGPYSECRRVDNHAVCSCQKEYVGTPPTCRPECMVSSECVLNKACINKKCVDPCPGTCGPDARCQVVNHNPICSCSPGYTGDPFVRCIKEQPAEIPKEPVNPCIPSPCGPNSQCRIVGKTPACSCLPNYIGRPPNCRPECTINAECLGNLACQNERCRDPCPGSCGIHATCVATNHAPHCTCEYGYSGDPFVGCSQVTIPPVTEGPRNPCNPSPCGANAVCKERNGAGSCICLPEYFGDPYTGCRPECVTNSDCDRSKACVNNKCKNPCPGTCGLNAQCSVINHSPSCTCISDYTGDPIKACHPISDIEPVYKNPCLPSPCGPYSECRQVNHHAVCSCQKNYVGSPPSCKPECMVSSECPQNKACINQRCADPCPGTCGQNAKCQVVNHNPICSCPSGYIGDPFVRCQLEQRPTTEMIPSENPCIPSPCGPNSECRVVGKTPACSCLQSYIGRPPNCRPECTINAECPGNLACQNEKCRDPCPGSCGLHTTCITVNHLPQCTCISEYTGDPFAGCTIQHITTTERPRNPCNPSPCGANAVCKERNGAGSCVCLPEYFGDPYTGCRPECVTNDDCERTKSCLNNKCHDPCPGTCGIHAECRVINHSPSCSCLPGYTGDPLSVCTLIPYTTPTPVDPCNPSPCGPNSICREINKHAVCSCKIGFIGTPPSCRPECLVSSECALDKACVNQKCVDPCPGTCGLNARCQVLTHNPICSCSVGYTGDAFTRCIKIESTTLATPTDEPCKPSPCGPYSQCRVINNTPACSCLTNYIGQPPNCRPECVIHAECLSNLACKNERCVDPCPGSCGQFAQCHVINHNPICTCLPGYTGNALVACVFETTTERKPQVEDPCFPSPCGPNAECINKNEVAACRCLHGFFGDPYSGCKRECESNSDCGLPLACIGYKCVDPCPGTCGVEAICTTVNHIPICSCSPDYTGDPFFSCRPLPSTPPPPTQDPCYPSPCGPNSQCRAVNDQAVCSCLANYVGNPPNCRPECIVSSECPLDKACINQKCADPCPNTCGLYALCNVRNHNPYCSCPPQFSGDPFLQCTPIPVLPSPLPTDAPPSCVPSPCGPHSQCKIISGNPVCSCLPDFIGSPPSCRPECVISSECASQLACINQHCRDPCSGSCGVNANCYVLNHVPICTCNEGHTGDPFALCSPIPITTPSPQNPCHPSPCGPNAICHGDGICECLPEYTGNPYESCRPECVISMECPRDKACIRNKCYNPCIGTCGQNANCDVINHIPVCSCPPELTGDPFTLCRPKPPEQPSETDPCVPSPCGPNSVCRNHNGLAVCSCLPDYQGSPPTCRPECIVSEECSSIHACLNKKCINPCVGVCGYAARCEVINHSPICSCREGQTGDPFKSCYDIPPLPPPESKPHRNPCIPSPCGPNSQCLAANDQPTCSCLQGFVGSPPNCRPECIINEDCPRNLACINNKCRDPCPGSCGLNAQCQVISNTVSCSCLPGYVGNPFEQCALQPQEEPLNPCEPSPCGANAICKQQNGAGSCSCISNYHGNPYEGCRPECVLSSDCPPDKACIGNKCHDPCPGICGIYATCTVINHIPSCNCIQGYIGDPFTTCHLVPSDIPPQMVNPCSPSPCGPNSKCVERNGQAVCSCLPNYQGSPPDCRPECVVNAECPTNRACHKYKCSDPCPGTCGVNARCEVIHHRPICSCPSSYTGDPFQRCYLAIAEPTPPTPSNPCVPSPCGPYSECHVAGNQASCRCRDNYIGQPPNCRPECVVNTDCSPTLACISEKCRDPCLGSCGINAKCYVQNHIPVCTCQQEYTGDPFTQCTVIIAEPPSKPDPCHPSPCGANAICNNGICTCISNYFGDPYIGCRPECTMNTDCSPHKACINQHCIDPCPGVCGQDAKCDVVNHIPTCSCPPQTTGDAFVVCRPIVNVDVNPCNPSPCGPHSICRIIENHAVCSCQPGLIGSPPSCRPECVVSAECSLTHACLQNRCQDPCPGTCGLNAKCNVINHNPICSCPSGYQGDPFRHCQLVPMSPPEPTKPTNPCIPSPCGPNALCQVHGETPACSCVQNYIGSPPNCRPECTINPECSSNLACINQRCVDPCVGSCGLNAVCSVINHVAICTCIQGYNGDPFASCQLTPTPLPVPQPSDPCYPSPCGPNTRCRSENNGLATCECLPEYQGNPYEGCRPECLISSDCIMNKACIRNKCQDPCPGTCGLSAICSVSNHIPICYCPEGTTGDAFKVCESIPKETVHRDPCIPSPCGPNTKCRIVNDIAICECLPGFEGSASSSGCHPECVINADCSRNKACVNNKCVDPCPGVCGYKAVCHTLNHSPVCSCPQPLLGDPFVECKDIPATPVEPCNPSPCGQNGHCKVVGGVASCMYPECIINQDCPRNKACFAQKCKDPCVGACGINAVCQVVNHDAVCSCSPGYYGEPRLQCKQETVPELKPECISNNDCSNDKACINQACRNPCLESSNVCALNAECRVQQHRPYCSCRDGLTGNAQSYCYEIGCRADTDCLPIQACINRECIDPCTYTQCGVNALCRVDSNHKARCYCPESYFGNPLVNCERPQCVSDSDCPLDLSCINQKCQNPCACAPNAMCNVISHVPSCRCPPGYTGNPYESCLIAPIVPNVECKMDADCSSKLACFNGICRNPCTETKPCGENAECHVVDTLPLRTMTCHCPPRYIGDADVSCKKVPEKTPGCESYDECPSTAICVNRQCVDPCAVRNPCAANANCQSINHKATCKCPEGLIGDAFTNCYKVPPALPECTVDIDCPSTRACINEKCQEPCYISNPCGIFAECNTIQHRPVCNCPDGWAGNPQIHCYKPECKSNSDCLYDKSCQNNNCISPCSSMSCGIDAQCIVQAHVPQCACPPGTQGNPLLSCVSVGCQYNEDCADHEACDRLNRKCRPVCERDTCAERASCTAKAHQPICSCLPGTQGNPYVECSESRIPPVSSECVKDSECQSQMACINQKCRNPCKQAGICSPDQECQVLDTYPVRTVMCVCPADSIATNDGRCKAIVPVECKADLECADFERCVKGSCIEACRIDPCGLNALCTSQNHHSSCSCPSHYVGNPHIECSNVAIIPVVPTIPECVNDDDCLPKHSCHNQKCINPCTLDSICGRGSFCHVENHQPICRCPTGYEGHPPTECRPAAGTQIVGCISNSECSSEKSCINKLCVSPCSCGPNADCKVIDHYPICYCRPGYSGNPQIGCVKISCESDEQCSFDKVCYNGDCVNPCIVGDPCAVNAECYGDNHRAACKCPPGYSGDPFIKCEAVECQVDVDCPQEKICTQQRCINPCTDVSNLPCASNAICYVRNHATGCRCPDYLPIGNPLAYCERKSQPVPDEVECKTDANCPSQLACIKNHCVNPCIELTPCSPTAKCSVLDSIPLRTLTCTCPEGWVSSREDECKPIVIPSPPGCESNADCPSNETCVNRMCRNPCNCGLNTQCIVQNHWPICSCKPGYEGNPNIACKLVGCRRDSECDSGRACINGNCINPCVIKNPCGTNAECSTHGNTAQCRCVSGFRGNPYERCHVVGCRSNNDCPDDRSCINAQCINPCVYEHPCASDAQCKVKNHIALCRCPPGMNGNPYTYCQNEPRVECKEDSDCSLSLACLNNRCQNPCYVLEPCNRPAACEVVSTLPVRTMICICPSGYISSGSGSCKAIPPVTDVACTADSQCPSDLACVNGICKNPCNCGPNAECFVKNNKPICSCVPGYEGNPNLECITAGCRSDSDCSGQNVCLNRLCVPACAADGSSCGTEAICYGIQHRTVCECPPGLSGNPQIACTLASCKSDNECSSDRACINKKCINPCKQSKDCVEPAVCIPYNHKADCSCPPGFVGNVTTGCITARRGCQSDSECPSKLACINERCVNPCEEAHPCGKNAICTVFDTTPVKTMICECPPGYEGNAVVDCIPATICPIEKGFVKDEQGNCVCPPGTALNVNDECRRCIPELGYKIDESGHCVCALERGLIVNERGECVCPPEHGYELNYFGNCVPAGPPGCDKDDDCPDNKSCENRKCINPCEAKPCGINAYCNATNHRAICQCPPNYYGNPDIMCNSTARNDFPKPAEMIVSCLSDGVQVRMVLRDAGFSGVLYVKGHSKEEECRKLISIPQNADSRMEIFKVMFGTCGLIHVNGQASFVLVIQKHPKLVTYKAQAYHIKCVYTTSEQNVTIGFNVSMLTTAGTIANTGPPPTCMMKIVTQTGQEISSAEIGENLVLQVDVHPTSIYGGFARSCVAKTLDNNVENEYIVTDENGCATDPSIFGEWLHDPDTQSLRAEFNAFKFPSSDNIRFQCNIRVCFGRCQPVNCRGYDAFGKRRKREISNRTDIDVLHEGQLREEITIESNAIFTVERREERLVNPTEEPQTAKMDDICISIIGLIVALIITALLALVAVAVSVSCWLMAYRRQPSTSGPLPHPTEFPNPIFANSERMSEPTPDYLS